MTKGLATGGRPRHCARSAPSGLSNWLGVNPNDMTSATSHISVKVVQSA